MSSFKNIFKVVGQEQTEQAGAPQAMAGQGGDAAERIQKDISENRVMLYMKGTPQAPMCGFSAAVIEMLEGIGQPYATRNVLEDPELRQGIKDFASWPTIPQLYVDGAFLGGCDIITEMHQHGELAPLLNK